ncbi:glycosyltransferase family 4 protein [Lachnospiraceae bacterium 62-35]
MKILIFGTGDYYERYKKWLVQEEILALLDNSLQKQGTEIDGIKVLSPKEGIELPYDKIIILSFYVREMKQQLEALKVDTRDILHFYDLHDFLKGKKPHYPIKASAAAREILNDNRKKQETILLLSTDMLPVGGPARVLFRTGKILKKNGFSVLFASMIDGELKEDIENAGIPVMVDESLQVSTMEEIKWINGFRLLICNTINFYVFLSKRNCDIPIIWWLHDSMFFYGGVDVKVLNNISQKNLKIVSVGEIPRKAMNKLAPQFEITDFLYGIKDKEEIEQRISGLKVCFAVMGYVEERKGQDILVKAIQRLPLYIRERLKVYMIGKNVSAMAKEIMQEILYIPEIFMTGVLAPAEFEEIFSEIDVLICPSREDPMPAVVSEAMRSKIPCIVSDAVGTARYIHEGVEGWIFQSGNAEELAKKIEWCVHHKSQLQSIGINARKLYEKYFSMDVFERNLLTLIKT